MLSSPHGTLVMLLVWHDGLYLAADSRRGERENDAEKLVRFGPQTILALRGKAMLADAKTGEPAVLASSHLQDKLAGPIIVSRYAEGASVQQRSQSESAAAQTVASTLTTFVEEFAEQWNTDELTTEAEADIRSGDAMLGVTIAQSEPDGWLLAVDVEYRIVFDGQHRITIRRKGASTPAHGYYVDDQIRPFWPPNCEHVIKVGPPEKDDDPARFLQRVFAAFIDRSTTCARDVGLPVDIAKVHQGEVTQLYFKKVSVRATHL
jgi:hypothetical protein